MLPNSITKSLCPTCGAEIDANIYINDKVYMTKTCVNHGYFCSVVEPDTKFYDFINTLPNNYIYDGILIDITDRCNLNCKVCLHDKKSNVDYRMSDIITYCMQNVDKAPFFLSGGEPTLHNNFFTLLYCLTDIAPVGLITNGIKLLEDDFFNRLVQAFKLPVLPIAFSIHPEIDIKDKVVEQFRKQHLKLSSVFWVISDIREIPEALSWYYENQDVVCELRIKAATNVWNTQHITDRIYVSDLYKAVSNCGHTAVNVDKGNKSTALNIYYKGLPVMLVAWYDIYNIDLNDIKCPPYYDDGKNNTRDFLSAALLRRFK